MARRSSSSTAGASVLAGVSVPRNRNGAVMSGCGCVCSDCLSQGMRTHQVCGFGCRLRERKTIGGDISGSEAYRLGFVDGHSASLEDHLAEIAADRNRLHEAVVKLEDRLLARDVECATLRRMLIDLACWRNCPVCEQKIDRGYSPDATTRATLSPDLWPYWHCHAQTCDLRQAAERLGIPTAKDFGSFPDQREE